MIERACPEIQRHVIAGIQVDQLKSNGALRLMHKSDLDGIGIDRKAIVVRAGSNGSRLLMLSVMRRL
jgi:hypothetical protein